MYITLIINSIAEITDHFDKWKTSLRKKNIIQILIKDVLIKILLHINIKYLLLLLCLCLYNSKNMSGIRDLKDFMFLCI